jgi:hypothetical protein
MKAKPIIPNTACGHPIHRAEPVVAARNTELLIRIRPHRLHYWDYEGTRAQLEAEGVIPPGTAWPESKESIQWIAGRFTYCLRRTRPEGLKGPMKLWTRGDWWLLRCTVTGVTLAEVRIEDQKRELERALHLQTPHGRAEQCAGWERYFKTREDAAYQRFMARIVAEGRKAPRQCGPAKPSCAPD